MRVICIWNTFNDKVVTQVARTKRELRHAKVNGKKPNKIILPDVDVKTMGINVLRNCVTYTGLIITTGGKMIYDGKSKKL